jgi:hypothetical protein
MNFVEVMKSDHYCTVAERNNIFQQLTKQKTINWGLSG